MKCLVTLKLYFRLMGILRWPPNIRNGQVFTMISRWNFFIVYSFYVLSELWYVSFEPLIFTDRVDGIFYVFGSLFGYIVYFTSLRDYEKFEEFFDELDKIVTNSKFECICN